MDGLKTAWGSFACGSGAWDLSSWGSLKLKSRSKSGAILDWGFMRVRAMLAWGTGRGEAMYLRLPCLPPPW